MIPSVNFHLWEPCNMRCKFCFATFQDVKQTILPKGHLSKEEAIEVVLQLADIGFEKITFAGGEPTLCPWLSDLISTAKNAGMATMIVTNGSQINDAFLTANRKSLDWIAISIDSLNVTTNMTSGRAICGTKPLAGVYYYELVDKIKEYGYGLKINTVVHSENYMESMIDFIRYAKPKRWKILQVLPIAGQNDLKIDNFKISQSQFEHFIEIHKELADCTNIVPESNDLIKGSYAMVDPAGRFFDNAKGTHNYSLPILQIGSRLAIQQVNYDFSKFVRRGGAYDWEIEKSKTYERITLSGEVASGKTTIGRMLAQELKYSFTSLGLHIREQAVDKGKDIVKFQNECLDNPEMDKLIDKTFSEHCNAQINLVIDYRLGFKFITNCFNIFLRINKETAIKRLKSCNRTDESFETIQERNKVFHKQFQKAYGLDYCDCSNYHLVIDVENFKSPEEIVDHIIKNLPR